MKRLTVLYDARCGFCVTCRQWLARQPKYVGMEFVPCRSAESARRFPGLEQAGEAEELQVVSDEGEVWRGAKAWIVALWALEDYREWSLRLAAPGLMPLARGLFALVGSQRRRLSGWLGLRAEESVLEELQAMAAPKCGGVSEAAGHLCAEGPPHGS